jgi:hypothetical protein
MRHNRKIIFLVIFLLLAPVSLPYGFSFSNKSVKNNLISHAELCCCGNDVNTCSDCCCSTDSSAAGKGYHRESGGSHRSDNTDKRLFIINYYCGGGANDIFVAPELNYFVSLSSNDNYQTVANSNETITLRHRGPRLTPPYKPPKS